MKTKTKQYLWVVECCAPKETTWTPWMYSKRYSNARMEMAAGKRACPDCKFRLVKYVPVEIDLLKRAANFLDEYCSDASLGLRDQIDAYVKEHQ